MNRRVVARAARGAVLGIAVYYAVWGGEYSAFDLRRLEQMRAAEVTALVLGRQEVDSLREQVTLLETDLAMLERVARERFGMIRDGERLYRFVAVDSTGARRPQAMYP